VPQIEQLLFVFAHLDGDWVPCGRLSLLEEGPTVVASNFAYGLRYLERRSTIEVDPLALNLRDKAAIRGKILFPPNDLTFFGAIRDAAPEAWGRRVIEARLKVPADSLPESRYLVYAGGQRAGALAIRRDLNDAARSGRTDWNSLENLAEGAERVDEGLPVPESLEGIFHLGTALGGKRPKACVRDEQGVLWMAKFSSHTDTLNVPVVEAATLELAAQAGLQVPPINLVNVDGRSIMMARRFDRYWGAPGAAATPALQRNLLANLPAPGLVEKRLHFVSAETLLACREGGSSATSYGQVAQAVRRHGHPDVIRSDNRELFARMVYNIFVSNDDDHLRNHGFLWDPHLQGWRLSPLYDVVPRTSLAGERMLHLGVGPQGRAATLDNAFGAREQFTLTADDAATVVAEIWSKVRDWRGYFEDFGVASDQLERIAPAFRHIDDIASAELRSRLP
jgi:serine/threonine-protein kinase HipA